MYQKEEEAYRRMANRCPRGGEHVFKVYKVKYRDTFGRIIEKKMEKCRKCGEERYYSH